LSAYWEFGLIVIYDAGVLNGKNVENHCLTGSAEMSPLDFTATVK